MAYREDTLIQAKQPSSFDSISDQLAAYTDSEQLATGNHPVLAFGQLTYDNGGWVCRCNVFSL